MNKKFMRTLAPVLALSCAASLLAGCGGSNGAAGTTAGASGDGAASGAAVDDTLVIATANEAGSVTTNEHNATAGDYLNKMTHNGLFYMDENLQAQLDLCESYEIVSDTEWIFKLRQGVKFHNGDEMTAEDVKASLELCKASEQVAQYGQSSGTIEIIDDYTIKMTTDGPQAGLLTDLTHHGNFILPADLIESGHDFNKEPIGTGPYKLVEWAKGESFTFEAFDDYFGGKAPIENVIWKVIPEGSSRTMALETGEVDLIVEVETTDVTRLTEADGITVFDGPGTGHNFMMINNEKAPFDNLNFRKAMAAAIDKAAIIQVALNGGGSVSNTIIPTCFPGVSENGAIEYNPEQAQKYFAESGLNPADCGFALICSDDTKLRVGQVIQSCLKETLGVDITLESMDLATYLDKTSVGDYQAAIGGYTSSDVLSYSKGVYHSSSINAANKTRTNDPEIDALIEKMQSTVDPEENLKIVTEFSEAIAELYPQVPLYLKNNTRAYNSKLEGFNCGASGGTYYHVFKWAE